MKKLIASVLTLALVAGLGLIFIFADETAVQDPGTSRGAANNARSSLGLFDKLGVVDASVNQFTGDLTLSVPLVSLPGNNGLDLNIALSYSSDVAYIMNNENYIQQASWVGAGWSLIWGTIIANQHGTVDVKDDEYAAILPDGKRVKLIRIGDHTSNSFELETAPYWLVTRSMSNDEAIGWTLVSPDGVTYKFGQIQNGQFVAGFGSDAAHSANRCVHRYGNWIGSSTATNENAIAYQWDLTRIIDVTGKHEIQFSYYQELATLTRQDSNPTQYTRASYLDYIIDTMGRKIVLVRGARNTNEFQNLVPSFDISQYEQSFLDRIEVYANASASTPLYIVDLQYSSLGTGTKYKRILQEIIFKGQNSNAFPSLKFTYAQDAGEPFGALEEIKLPNGGSRTIQYSGKLNNYLDQDADPIIQQQTSNPGPSDTGQPDVTQPHYFANSNTIIAFIDPEEGKLHLHKWTGQTWISASYTGYSGGDWSNNYASNLYSLRVNERSVVIGKKIKVGGNFIEVVVYNWNESTQSWPASPISLYSWTLPNDKYYISVAVSESKMVFDLEEHLGSVDIRHSLYVYVWDSAVQNWHNIIQNYHPSFDDDVSDLPELFVTENALFLGTKTFLDTWTRKAFIFEKVSGADALVGVPDGDATSSAGQAPTNFMNFGYFSTWEPGLFRLTLLPAGNSLPDGYDEQNLSAGAGAPGQKPSYFRFSTNHIAVCEYIGSLASAEANIMDRHRTASGFTGWANILPTVNAAGYSIVAAVNERWLAYMKRKSSGSGQHGAIQIHKWNNGTTVWAFNDSLASGIYSSYNLASTELSLLGDKLVLHAPEAVTDVYFYSGTGWGNSQRIFNNAVIGLRFQDKFIHFAGANYVGAYRPESGVIKVMFTHGNNEWGNTITDYVVEKIIHNDGFSTQTSVENYSYATPKYDPTLTFAGYTTATVDLEGVYGKTTTTFINDLLLNWKFRGLPDKIDKYAESNNSTPLETIDHVWTIYEDANGCYEIRPYQQYTTLNGVTVSTTYNYNDSNGLVSKITETGNNGDRVTETAYAFQQPDYNGANGMDDKNMLSQVYSTTVSELTTQTTYFTKNWTTWVQSDGYWHPDKTYAWNGTGTPPNDPTSGSYIETSYSIYDAFGNVTQTRNANKFLSATIWAHNNSLPIATATNGGASTLFFDNFERDGLQDPNVKPRRSGNAVLFTNIFDGTFWRLEGTTETQYHLLSDAHFISSSAVIEFDIRVRDTTKPNYVVARDHDNTVADGPYLVWDSDGRLKWNAPKNEFSQMPSYVANKWYHVRIETNMTANPKTYSVRVDGQSLTPASGSLTMSDPDFAGLSEILYWTGSGSMDIDNVRVYPKGTMLVSTTYDPNTFLVRQTQDENGLRTYPSYDDFYRTMRVDDNSGQPLSESGMYFSRSGSANDAFDPALPNATWQLEFFERSGHDTFVNGANWDQINASSPATFNTLVDGDLVATISSNASGITPGIKSKTTMSSEDGFVRVDFKMTAGSSAPSLLVLQDPWPNATNLVAIRYHAYAQKFKLHYGPGSASVAGTFKLTAPLNQWYSALIYKYTTGSQTRCLAWVYPRGKGIDLSDSLSQGGFPPNWQPSVRATISAQGESYYLANFYRGKARSTIVYSDGLGRSIQTQSLLGDKVTVSGAEYNASGAASKTYAFKYPKNNTWAFFDWVPLQPPPPTDSSIYVQETEYDDTPLQRVKRVYPSQLIGKPNYKSRYQEYVYDANVAGEVSGYNANTLFRTKVTDEAGTVTYSYTDVLGNQVANWTILAGSNNDLFSRFFYDILGRQTESRSPEYHSGEYPTPTDANTNFKSTFVYNSLGRLVSQKLVDESGNQNFKYDKLGNLRFSQNNKQSGWGEFTYYRYNALNLLEEEGVCINAGKFTQTLADSTIWPTTGDSSDVRWKIRRYYNWNFSGGGTVSFEYGHVGKEEINTDNDTAPEITYLYRYDEFGNVTAVQHIIDGISRTVTYQYDLLGNPTMMTYPSGRVITYGVDNVGRVTTVRRQN